jgi:hypothetical protein
MMGRERPTTIRRGALTPDQVREMRAGAATNVALAERYGVEERHVSRGCRGLSRADVT